MGLLGTPKNVLTGVDSNGKTMTLFEWDFETFAAMQGFQAFMWLLGSLFLGCIFAPILTFLLIKNFTGRFKIGYLFVFVAAGLFIYEVLTGGIMLNVASIVCDDWIVAILVGLNFASIAVCLFVMVFGPLIKAFIHEPLGDMTQDDINALDEEEKVELARKYVPRYIAFIAFVLMIAVLGYLFSLSITKENNWVNKRLKLDQTVQLSKHLQDMPLQYGFC